MWVCVAVGVGVGVGAGVNAVCAWCLFGSCVWFVCLSCVPLVSVCVKFFYIKN